MIIDLPFTNIFISQMKLVEQHDYDLIYSSHAIWHNMPEYNLQVSFNKSIKPQEVKHYGYYTTDKRCY